MKRFFNEKEVTSTLVMDALVSGVKQIEEYSRLAESKKVLPRPAKPSQHTSNFALQLSSLCRWLPQAPLCLIVYYASCMPEAARWAFAVQSQMWARSLKSAWILNCKRLMCHPVLQGKKDKDRQQPLLSVDAERNEWTLRSDLVSVIECSLSDSFPAGKDDGKPAEGGLAVRNAQVSCDTSWWPQSSMAMPCSCQKSLLYSGLPRRAALPEV